MKLPLFFLPLLVQLLLPQQLLVLLPLLLLQLLQLLLPPPLQHERDKREQEQDTENERPFRLEPCDGGGPHGQRDIQTAHRPTSCRPFRPGAHHSPGQLVRQHHRIAAVE